MVIINAMYAFVCAAEQLNREFYDLACFIMSLYILLCILVFMSINPHFLPFQPF